LLSATQKELALAKKLFQRFSKKHKPVRTSERHREKDRARKNRRERERKRNGERARYRRRARAHFFKANNLQSLGQLKVDD